MPISSGLTDGDQRPEHRTTVEASRTVNAGTGYKAYCSCGWRSILADSIHKEDALFPTEEAAARATRRHVAHARDEEAAHFIREAARRVISRETIERGDLELEEYKAKDPQSHWHDPSMSGGRGRRAAYIAGPFTLISCAGVPVRGRDCWVLASWDNHPTMLGDEVFREHYVVAEHD